MNHLIHLINRALLVLGLYDYLPGLPVIAAWTSPEACYGFAEFRCRKEMLRLYEGKNFNSDITSKTINVALGNLTMSGCQIRVGRTRNSPISQTGAYQNNQFAFYSSFSEKMLDN